MQDNMSAEATGRSEVDLMSIIDSIGPTSSSDSGDSSTAQTKTTVPPPTPGTPLDVSSMLGQLGVEFPEARQPGPVTPERRSQLSKDNIARMAVEAGAAGIGPGDMLFAGLGGGADRKTDVDPAALRTALVQDAATDAFGETVGSLVGGMMDAGAAMQKLPAQLTNMATRWFTGGEDVFETFDEGTARFLTGGYTSSEALDDSTSENRSRFVPADMSPEEFAAAVGESSPFARAVGSAFGDVGFMLAATVLGGGVGGATAAPRAAGTLGKLWAPVRAFVANPGGQMYLGAMGGRSAVGMSSGYDRYLENKNKFVASMNAAYDDLGLQYEKLTPEEYSRGIDMGTSIASGIGTIALEAVSSGLGTALGGRRVMNRLMFGKADKVVADGFLPLFRGAGASLAASGSAEGAEEFLEVYKDAFLRGVWSPYEDGRFLRTFDFSDIGKTFKQHAPEAFTSFAIGFIAGAPLGGLGGLARTKRRSQVTQAFQSALAEDQALREDGDPASVAAATAVARYIAEGEMQGSSDPAIRKLVIDHLKRTTLQEVGQVTEEQLNDPEWVASFVQRNPMLAVAMIQDIDELSRRNMEWLTGPASEGRVPSRAARARFRNLLRQQVDEFVPVYMRGWAVRATEEVAVLERELQEASRVPGEEGLARRMAAAQRLGHIRRVRRLWDQAMVEGLMPSESEFAEWTGLDAELGKIDEDGTADATEDSPATVENESSIPQEREPDPPRGGDVAPGIVAAANRSLARKAKDPRLLRRLARRGVAEAAMRLSEMHATGENGVEVHAAKSEHWLNVAMSLVEDSDALMYMGRFHERNARAARREKSRAYEMARAKWYYRRAANQGSMEANVRMGEIALERGETDTAREQFRLGGVYRPEVEVPSGDARVPLEAPAVQPAPEAAPEAGTPQAAPGAVSPPREPKGFSAIDEAPVEVRNEDIYEEMQEDMSRREQARQEREAQQAADKDAATAERLTGEVRAAAANDNLQVRLVKTEGSRARQKVAAALSKLGKRVQFVRILEDIPQEPSLRNPTGRRRRVASGFRGFVSSDPDVVYVVVLPEAMTNESDLVYEYLQAALHETAHGLVQDPEIRAEVEKVISAELTAEFARRFDLGTSPEERREEELVYTLTQGLIRSSGVDSLLLPEDMAGKVAAALKQVFNRIKFMLPGQQRKELLNSIIRDRIASKKKAKPISKDNPAREVVGQSRAATPKPQAEPKKTGGDQQGTLFMRERTSPQDRQRIAELAETIDLFDERGYGTLSHPVDGNDVDAEAIIGDLLAYSAKVPRKYLKGTEEFEYLASAIHRVLIEKSADSTDYERAAAVMSNALGEGIADYDQIVVAARRMGWEGTDKQVPFDIVSEEDVDPRRLMELMDDPDGFADSGPRFMREREGSEPAPTERVEAIANEYSPGLAKFATAMVWEYHILDREVKRLMEMYNIPEEMRASDEYKVGPGYYHEFMRQFATQEMRPFEDAVKALAKKLKVSRQDVISMVTEYTYVTQIPERAEALRKKNAARIEGKIDQARRDVGFLDEADIDEIIKRETAIGMSEEDAAKRQAEIEQQFSGEPMFMDLVQRIRAMNRKTLEIRRDEGLITQAVFDDMVERYPNYVPIVTSVLNETNQQEEMRQRTPGTAKLALRRNVGGQIADAKDLPKFWMMAWSLTTLDRTTAAHEASRNRGHNALHRLAMSGMTGLVETASLEDARADAGRLERIRIAAQEKRTGEQLSDGAKDRRVGGAERDAETNLRDGVRGGVPKVLQLKLDRDMDLTDDAVLEEIRSVRESEDGLTASERARNRELASEAMQAREYLNSDEGRNELAALQSEALEIRREEAMYRRDFGIKRGDEVPAELQEIRDRLKKVNDKISNLKNREKSVLRRVVKPRDESARAARLEELEKGRRKRKKGDVVYVKINDETLAKAMLVRRRGWATFLMQSDNRLMSTLARNYMRVMNFLRFAYVSASFGFLKGEALRSPVQAVAMARVAADERLEPEVAERFLENIDRNLGFKYFTSTTPGIAVRGAIRAFPFRSRWRSFRHLMRGGEPRNETERIYAQAMEDGVLMGGLYTLENFDTAVAKAKRNLQVMMEPGRSVRGTGARVTQTVDNAAKTINDSVDLVTGGLDFVNRMLVYESAIEAGIDRKTAAVMARDATVDFAAKGTVSKQVNQFYLFFSPRMQGIYQLIRAFKASKPEGATKTDVAMQFITGKGKSNTVPILRQLFFWSFAAAILRELLFEDDEDPETKTSKFAGLQSILIPVWYSDDGTYQSFELNNPYGFGAVARLGQRMADFLMGDSTPLEMLGGVTSDFATELFPLTITGTNQAAIQVVPTIGQPLMSAIYNVDWKGGPVYPDGAVFGAGDKRESQMYWADASGFSIVTASLLSDVTGFVARMVGSANTRGVEISPSQLDYIISRYAPGIARDAYAALSMSWRGLPTTTDRAPFLNAFLTQSGGQTVIPGMFRDMEGLRADMKEDKKLYGEAEARRRYGREFNFFENAKFRSRYLPNSEQGLSFDSSVYQIRKLKNTRNEFLKAGEYDKAKRVQEQIVQAQGAILGSALRFRNRDGGGLDDWLQDNVLKRIGGGNR